MRLFETRDRTRHIWSYSGPSCSCVIGLARRFGTVRLETACRRALAFDDPKYRTVKTILENAIDLEPSDEPAFDRLTDTYTGRGRFSRDTTKLLTH